MNQNVAGSIPDQGTCLGCRFSPRSGVLGRVQEAPDLMFLSHIDVSLPLFLPPFLPL